MYRWFALSSCCSLVVGFHFTLPPPLCKVVSASSKELLVFGMVKKVGNGIEPEVVPDVKDFPFEWNKQWYPVLSLKDTDPGRAHALQLLGKDLVMWRDKEERWTCFDDRCPHRAAPLTQGRVEGDGSLLCAYHAWRFDADGKCLSIPQSVAEGRGEAQPKACAKVYPTQVAQDILWVWAENGPDAALESALTPAPLIPELSDEEGLKSKKIRPAPIGQNDLPYGWDTLMENLVDPAHVIVSHHGIAGNRYAAAPIYMAPHEGRLTPDKDGFDFMMSDDEKSKPDKRVRFRAPCLVTNEASDPFGTLKLVLYGTPTRPGYCRLIGRQVYIQTHPPTSMEAKQLAKEPKKSNVPISAMMVVAGISAALPAWLLHVLGHLFLNQDMVFLHHQEKILASAGYDSSTYGQAVFVPASCDRSVMSLRKWITEFGSGGPKWDKGCDQTLPPRQYNRDILFDVYEGHTKNCASCLGALKNVKKALSVAKAAAVVSFAWTVLRGAHAVGSMSASPSASVVNAVTVRAMLPGVALMVASMGAVKALEKLHGMFYTYPFHHQDWD